VILYTLLDPVRLLGPDMADLEPVIAQMVSPVLPSGLAVQRREATGQSPISYTERYHEIEPSGVAPELLLSWRLPLHDLSTVAASPELKDV
jgi:hypothetical protein